MIHRFDTLSSTNDEAVKPIYHEGDIIWAEHQSAGRGQRGHTWESRAGENLTFSIIFKPYFLAPQDQFMLLRVIALGMVDALRQYDIKAQIKWTNDIYVEDQKLVGILMEHKLQGSQIGRAIAGIGINVNQTTFNPELPNPTSIRLLKGQQIDREELLQTIAQSLMARYQMLQDGECEKLILDYNALLYRLSEWHTYVRADGEQFEGKILGVAEQGELKIETKRGDIEQFLFKEVFFLLNN